MSDVADVDCSGTAVFDLGLHEGTPVRILHCVRLGKDFYEDLGSFFDDDEGDASAARTRWSDRLTEYVNKQGSLDAVRLRPVSEPPWPGDENPMFLFLLERTCEIAAESDIDAALRWLGLNAWLEGCLAERTRIVRALDEA